ncbi:vegetative cell wall protein gp1-like [Iris pallida]|uniref:Vegetative cell wall protein gp1-like n=1 Tax=Iris pallida TaxID=29817 RepID=A0AAX6I336_IRIPA|nr:vegetative cell wall protein gp1-like [Iris pallida]
MVMTWWSGRTGLGTGYDEMVAWWLQLRAGMNGVQLLWLSGRKWQRPGRSWHCQRWGVSAETPEG